MNEIRLIWVEVFFNVYGKTKYSYGTWINPIHIVSIAMNGNRMYEFNLVDGREGLMSASEFQETFGLYESAASE